MIYENTLMLIKVNNAVNDNLIDGEAIVPASLNLSIVSYATHRCEFFTKIPRKLQIRNFGIKKVIRSPWCMRPFSWE